MTNVTWDKQTVHTAAALIRTAHPGVSVTVKVADGIVDGQVIPVYRIDLRVADARTGNGETRSLRASDDADAIISEMMAALKASAKRTRGAIRAERRGS